MQKAIRISKETVAKEALEQKQEMLDQIISMLPEDTNSSFPNTLYEDEYLVIYLETK